LLKIFAGSSNSFALDSYTTRTVTIREPIGDFILTGNSEYDTVKLLPPCTVAPSRGNVINVSEYGKSFDPTITGVGCPINTLSERGP
jgi:hypothetical protein